MTRVIRSTGPVPPEPPGGVLPFRLMQREGDRARAFGAVAVALVSLAALALRLKFLLGGGGPLASPTDYDDGVYFSASALLVRGVLPYRDFVFVHPPGIAWFYAIVSWWHDPAASFVAARLIACAIGAVNTALVGAIVLRSGSAIGALVAAALYATYPDAVTAEHSTFLEPLLNLGCLSAAYVWLSTTRQTPRSRVPSGLLAGMACAVKLLGGIWVLAAVVSPPRERRWTAIARFLAGGAAAGLALLAPLVLAAPSRFFAQVLRFQLTRPPDGALTAAARLPQILDGGHLAATALAAVAILGMAVLAMRGGTSAISREQRFFAFATILTIAAFAASSSYWSQYNAYLAASQCVLAGLGAAMIVPQRRGWSIAVALGLVLAIALLQATPFRRTLEASRVRRPEQLALRDVARAALRQGSLFAFDPSWGLVAGRLPAHGDGAPVIVDSYGAMLMQAMEPGVRAKDTEAAFRSNAPQPEVRRRLERSQFVISGWRGNWQLPDDDRRWMNAHFFCVTPGLGELCLGRRLASPFSGLTVSAAGSGVSFGDGWYYEEGTAPSSWRWMAGRAVVALPPVAGRAHLHFELYVPLESLHEQPSIEVLIDGAPIDRFVATSGEVSRSYEVDGNGRPRTLMLTTSATIVPAQTGSSGDTRVLGVSLKRLVWLDDASWRGLFEE